MKQKVSLGTLTFLASLAVLLFFLSYKERNLIKMPWYKEKIRAAKLMLLMENAIKEKVTQDKTPIDRVSDPNETGLIGQEFTLITTDRGILDAKLTTLNPNFAAVVVDMLKRAGVSKGDLLAVAVTGSMPALNIAVHAAVETLGLKPVIITSVGASSWGANNPALTWLDMEALLYNKGLIHHRSVSASIGGGKDRGRGLSPEGRRLILEAIRRNQVRLIHKPTLEESIQQRMKIYHQKARGKRYAAYINVGGGLGSLGASINGELVPAGLSQRLAFQNFPVKGTMIRFGEQGVPIIHLLRIEEIAQRYELPTAPVPLPEIGMGKVYFEERHDVFIAALSMILLTGALFMAVRLDLFHRLFLRRQEEVEAKPPKGGYR